MAVPAAAYGPPTAGSVNHALAFDGDRRGFVLSAGLGYSPYVLHTQSHQDQTFKEETEGVAFYRMEGMALGLFGREALAADQGRPGTDLGQNATDIRSTLSNSNIENGIFHGIDNCGHLETRANIGL